MAYDFTSMWNLKSKINEQANRNRFTDTENIMTVTDGRSVGDMGEKVEEMKKYKFLLTEMPQGCKV